MNTKCIDSPDGKTRMFFMPYEREKLGFEWITKILNKHEDIRNGIQQNLKTAIEQLALSLAAKEAMNALGYRGDRLYVGATKNEELRRHGIEQYDIADRHLNTVKKQFSKVGIEFIVRYCGDKLFLAGLYDQYGNYARLTLQELSDRLENPKVEEMQKK
jgi:hypothetical protein